MKQSEPYTSYKAVLHTRKEIRFHVYLNGSVKIAISKHHPGFEEDVLDTPLVRAAFSLLPSDVTEIKGLIKSLREKIEKGEIKP